MIAFLCKCGARPAKTDGFSYSAVNMTVVGTNEQGETLYGPGRLHCDVCDSFGHIVCDGKEQACYGTPTWCVWHQCAPKVFR